jgi:succinate dehydrogenase subunit C
MPGVWTYIAQRTSAMIMAPLVILHLGIVVYAVQTGLTAEAILSRTQGSLFWGLTYGLFIVAVAVHAAIGIRAVVQETTRWRGRSLDLATTGFGLFLLVLGGRAVAAVVL